jgi:hypothetical protein
MEGEGMEDAVTISIRIDQSPFASSGEPMMLRYQIGREQALDLHIGRAPPTFDLAAMSDWNMRRERAEGIARHIAADLAHKLLQAFAPRP